MEAELRAFVLVLTRVSGFVAIMPVFGGRALPRLVKVSLALALSLVWYTSLHDTILGGLRHEPNNYSAAVLAWDAMRELLIGLMLAFGMSLFIEPAKIAGAYIGQELGLTLATVNDPTTRAPVNVFSQLFEAFAVLMFLSLDMHHLLIAAVQLSFSQLPVGTGTINVPFPWIAGRVQATHEQGLMIAAPIGIGLFLIVIAMALLSKVAPQMNVFAVGVSLRLIVGLGAVIVFLPTALFSMRSVIMQMRQDIVQLLTLL